MPGPTRRFLRLTTIAVLCFCCAYPVRLGASQPDLKIFQIDSRFYEDYAGNYQIAAITALVLLVPSVGFMLLIERFLKAETLAKIG